MEKWMSVITSTFNKSRYLDLLLAGFTLQDDSYFEIVIVDDGSTDNTEEIVSKYTDQLNIQYIYQANTGVPGARNKALESANGQYIVIIDDDRIPSPSFISEHKKALSQDRPIVSIGAQYRLLTAYSNQIPLPFEDWMRLFDKYPELTETTGEIQFVTAADIIHNFDGVVDKFTLGLYDPGQLMRLVQQYGDQLDHYHFGWSKSYGGNMAFDRSKLTSPLAYDPGFTGYAVEDVDISYQLYLQNYKFVYTKTACNYHQEHPRNERERQFQFRNIKHLLNKYNNLDMHLHELEIHGEADFQCVNFVMDLLVKDPSIVEKMKEFAARKR
ncbi:glycosyltransferase family 2 protein [Paenibacillus kobensis]|uniref:glycosyltransferase family 2 protein n=1 Tax=Paenibacillus kobensis TaxID=59841 RepID=UPI000FDC1064|nr:glycosyltransferase family 2 protein [Paenibacillus kobensis]